MSYTKRAQIIKENDNLINIILAGTIVTIILSGCLFASIMNLAISREEVKDLEANGIKQDLKHSKQVKELNDRINQLVKENETLSDMRPVHGVVSEY